MSHNVIQCSFQAGAIRKRRGIVQRQANGSALLVPVRLAGSGKVNGQPLPSAVLHKMEAAFNATFSDIRVHVGPEAGAIGAVAFARGSDLYFAPGQYDPYSMRGQQLLGHELAHVVQQRAGRVRNPFGAGVAVVEDRELEDEADQMGRAAANGLAAHPRLRRKRWP